MCAFKWFRPRVLLLLALLCTELFLGLQLFRSSQEPIRFGFLIKNGDTYVVAWKRGESFIKVRSYGSLRKALVFARDDLRLSVANNPRASHGVQNVWFQTHDSAYQVVWENTDIRRFHHLTFARRSDAIFFANAFKRGDYSPSPLGHSIYLSPIPE